MKKSDFYFDLPERLIAQHPLEQRDASRLMVLSPGHLLHAGAVRAAEARLRGRFGPAPFSLAEARDALGCSRRCALLLLEHWDASGVTRRQGEGRIFSTSA